VDTVNLIVDTVDYVVVTEYCIGDNLNMRKESVLVEYCIPKIAKLRGHNLSFLFFLLILFTFENKVNIMFISF
jgi:hypothetical protein